MDSIWIKPSKKEELEFLKEMASKMEFDLTIISDEDLEDIGFLKAMEEGRKQKEHVSRKKVMKKLREIADE